MALDRKKQKIFAKNAQSTDLGVVGSKNAGNPQYSTDIETLQSLTNWETGLRAQVSNSDAPYLQDQNSILYIITSQLAYIFQSGIPEWNSQTEYFSGRSIVLKSGKIFVAIADSINVEPEVTSGWESSWKNLDIDWGLLTGSITNQADLWNILLKGLSYNASIATAIGGYPKGARLLYKNGRYEYYIESLKDNNSTEPTDESIYIVPNKAVISGVAVVETTSQLPTATEDTLTDRYLCLADNKIYFTAINQQTQTYYWQGFSLTNSVFFAENTRAYWIYDTNNSSYVNANTIYSWVKTEDVKSVPMPDYSSINTTYSADVEHLASNNIIVMVHLQAQDKTTPAQFLIGANAGLTADVEIASWSINGASSRADWLIPVPNGYRWKVVSGNITTVTIKVLNII